MALCCLSLFSITAFARSYNLSGTDMSIDIDDSKWYVFTRDNILNNPELEDLGITYDYINDVFFNNKVYVDAMLIYDDDTVLELFIRKNPIEKINNLSAYDDDDVLDFGKVLANNYSIEEYSLYKTDYKFVKFEHYDGSVYLCEFVTVINGENYTLTFQSPKPFNSFFYQEMELIVNSVCFEIDAPAIQPEQPSIFDGVLEKAIAGAVTAGIFSGVSILCAKKKKKSKENKSATIHSPSTPSTPKQDNQNQITHICLSDPNEQPEKQGNFNVCGSDILLEKTEKRWFFNLFNKKQKHFLLSILLQIV